MKHDSGIILRQESANNNRKTVDTIGIVELPCPADSRRRRYQRILTYRPGACITALQKSQQALPGPMRSYFEGDTFSSIESTIFTMYFNTTKFD